MGIEGRTIGDNAYNGPSPVIQALLSPGMPYAVDVNSRWRLKLGDGDAMTSTETTA